MMGLLLQLKEQMLDEDLEADGNQDEATEDFGTFVEAVADFLADQQTECREQEGRDSDDQDGRQIGRASCRERV